MRALLLSVLVLGASAQSGQSICGAVNSYLPSICSCVDASQAAAITCQVEIPDGIGGDAFNFGARIVIDICGTPDFVLYLDYGEGYQNFYQFGIPETSKLPIPDLSYDIPFVGTVGLEAEITVSGQLSDLTTSVGIGGCIGSSDCDSQLPVIGQYLPVQLVSFTGLNLEPIQRAICGTQTA